MSSSPDLRLLIPANREGNWSDLLGALIETDATPILRMLDLDYPGEIHVLREWTVAWEDAEDRRRSDRADLVLKSATKESVLAVIEVKVLAPVGGDQLERYADSIPARRYRLLQLQRFAVRPAHQDWDSLTWENVLDAYSLSENNWVAETARAWRNQLTSLIPDVDGSTVWRNVRDGAEGDIDLRARGAWLHSNMASWCTTEFGFSETAGGRSWVVDMAAATSRPDYSVRIEFDEGLAVQKWNDPKSECLRADRLQGPTVLIGLAQWDVENAHSFDWQILTNLFQKHILDTRGVPRDGRTWRKGAARRSKLQGWKEHISDSDKMPNWIGQGYDMSKKGWCIFGARFNLGPDLTLLEIDYELRRTEELVKAFAADV